MTPRNHIQECLELIDQTLADYQQFVHGTATATELNIEIATLQQRLAASVCLGHLSSTEVEEIYIQLDWPL